MDTLRCGRSLADGHLQHRIAQASNQRHRQYGEGKRDIVGTTVYRLDKEKPVGTLLADTRPLPTDGAVFCERLDARRLDDLIGEQS